MKPLRTLSLISCLTIAALMAFTGCAGYRLGNVQGEAMRGVKLIHVPTVKNRSFEPNLAIMATNAIIRAIDQDGTYRTTRAKGADAVLEVVITEVKRTPRRSSRSDTELTEEYEVLVKAEVTVRNYVQGTKVFDKQIVEGSSSFFTIADYQEAERQALPLAAEDLGRKIAVMIAEGW